MMFRYCIMFKYDTRTFITYYGKDHIGKLFIRGTNRYFAEASKI